MSDLTPYYVAARESRQREIDRQAGDEAWSLTGPKPAAPAATAPAPEPASGAQEASFAQFLKDQRQAGTPDNQIRALWDLLRRQPSTQVDIVPASQPRGKVPPAPAPTTPAAKSPAQVGGEAVGAVVSQFTSGAKNIADALVPPNPGEEPSAVQRTVQGALGLLRMAFPFSAGAEHVGGEAMDRLARESGDLTDEKLKANLDRAKLHAPGEVPIYEHLLSQSYEQRIAGARAAGEMQAGFLGSMLGGYGQIAKAAGKLEGRATKAAASGLEAAPGGVERRAVSRGTNAGQELTNTRAFLEESTLTPARVSEELGIDVQTAAKQGLVRAENDGFRLTPEGVGSVQAMRDQRAGERALQAEQTAVAGGVEAPGATQGALDRITPIPGATPQKLVEDAGLTYRGVTPDNEGNTFHWFDDPKTGSTLALPESDLTAEGIAATLAENRKAWGLTPGGQRIAEAAPGASVVLDGSKASENHLRSVGGLLRPLIDEAGASKAGLTLKLGQAAAGALVGSYVGDTTEDRVRNAMIGAGVAVVTPAAVRKATSWLVENASSVRNLVRKPTNEYPPEVGQRLEKLFTGYEAELNIATRGTRPHSLAWEQAEQMIRDGRMSLDTIKQSFPGKTMNDSEAMSMIKTAADHLAETQAFAKGLQEATAGGQPLSPEQINQFLGRLFEIREFLPRPRGVVAETGRTASAMNEPTKGYNRYMDQWQKLFIDPERGLSPDRLVDAVAGFESVEQHLALARLSQQPGFADMAIEGLYGALLGPVTLVVNGASNALAMAYMPLERTGMAMVGGVQRLLGADARTVTHWSEPFADIYGYATALPMAFKNAKKAFLTGERAIGGGTPKVESLTVGPLSGITSQYLESTLIGKVAETTVPLAVGAAMYAAGVDPVYAAGTALALHPRMWPLIPRGMAATDELAKTMLFEAGKWSTAVRRAAAAPPALREQVLRETVQNPNALVRAEGERLANEFTFNTPSPAVQKINEWGQEIPGAYRVFVKTVVPFLNVPVDLVKFSAQRTLGLQQLHATWWSDLTSGGVRTDKAVAQVALGAAWLGGVMKLMGEGDYVGSGPADPNQLREWLADGNQENSVRFGNKSFGINRADPWGQMASIMADWSRISAHIDDASNDQIASALLMVVSKDMMSKSYLEGASNFLEAVTNRDPNKAYHWLYQYTGTGIPSVVKQFRRIEDPHLREVRDLLDSKMNQVPEFSKKLAPRKNIFADPLMSHEPIGYGIDYVNPFPMKTIKNDPAARAVLDNKISVSMPAWSIYGNPDRSWTLEPQRASVGVPLTHALRDELIDLIGRPLKKEWLEFVQSTAYDKRNEGPDSMNALVFRRLHQKFQRAAIAELTDRHPELLRGMEDALARRAQSLSEQQGSRPASAGPSIMQRLQGPAIGVTP